MLIGTACDTNDVTYIPFFTKLKEKGLLDFLELHTKSNMTLVQLTEWAKTGLVKYIHAETGGLGEFVPKYLEQAEYSYNFLSNYNEIKGIVVHLGLERQNVDFSKIKFPNYIIPENMPYFSSFKEKMVGYSPKSFSGNFTFDFAHAWMTSRTCKMDARIFINRFLSKKPAHFHLTDCLDQLDHLVLGTGELDYEWAINQLPKDATLTLETDNIMKEYRKENIIKDLTIARKVYENRCCNSSKGNI